MNEAFTQVVTEDEVYQTVFDIGPDKAPWPDEITRAFYQQFLPDIKTEIIDEVNRIFKQGEF